MACLDYKTLFAAFSVILFFSLATSATTGLGLYFLMDLGEGEVEEYAAVPATATCSMKEVELQLVQSNEEPIPLKVEYIDEVEEILRKETPAIEEGKAEIEVHTLDGNKTVVLWSDSAGFPVEVVNHGDINEIVEATAITGDGEELFVTPESFNLNPDGRQTIFITTKGTKTLTHDTTIKVEAKSLTSKDLLKIEVEKRTESYVKMVDSGNTGEGCGKFALYG
ncbi:hypothetical protein ACFLRC_03535 [Candidatus Altiarchaeota archaeon]